MDHQLASTKVDQFVQLLERDRAWYQTNPSRSSSSLAERYGEYRTDDEPRPSATDVFNSVSLVRQIADELGPKEIGRRLHSQTANTGWRFSPWLGPATELRGVLATQEERDRIFDDSGPRLAASRLHRWVWDHAAGLWDDGHHLEAVRAAATAIFDFHLPTKLGQPKDTLAEALCGAFKTAPPRPGEPRLRLPGYQEGTQDWSNAHQGAQNLGLACAKAVRNLVVHTTEPAEETEALEALAALSLFARWADAAAVVSAEQ